ncbi:MAG: hypothetical protein JXB47_12465, partial [Anaerolineae bacterium]|nr:hypothetical protein [Anaerolineae bacterium]
MFVAVMGAAIAAAAHLAGQSALAPFDSDTPVMTVAIPTARPLAAEIEPFAQVNPAIVGALQRSDLRPLDSLGGQVVPVGAWLPVTGNTLLSLPTPTPTITPTPTDTPTVTPIPPTSTATTTPPPPPTPPH